MPAKLALVVRTDLGMGRGKIAAQAAHAAVLAALRQAGTAPFAEWLHEGQPKIVLKVGGPAELDAVRVAAVAAGVPVEVVHDAGRTQVAAGTATCCAVGPAATADVDRVVGALSLL